jgi:hypothetical protein
MRIAPYESNAYTASSILDWRQVRKCRLPSIRLKKKWAEYENTGSETAVRISDICSANDVAACDGKSGVFTIHGVAAAARGECAGFIASDLPKKPAYAAVFYC